MQYSSQQKFAQLRTGFSDDTAGPSEPRGDITAKQKTHQGTTGAERRVKQSAGYEKETESECGSSQIKIINKIQILFFFFFFFFLILKGGRGGAKERYLL